MPPNHYLIAPLNWGLGHASRCIPLIRQLLAQGHRVTLASDGAALALLRAEFPQLAALQLPSYHIRYPTKNMVFNMLWQLPNIFRAARAEHIFLQKIIQQIDIQIVISDNRYGCFGAKTKNIFLTHQINLQAPLGGRFLSKIQQYFIRHFDEIWVPDFASEPNLSGKLSHGGIVSSKIHFIGPLTRMKFLADVRPTRDVIAVLSGPEPQRAIFQEQIISQALALPHYTFLIVEGDTSTKKNIQIADNVQIMSFLTSEELNQQMAASRFVVARSGYSTLMDLWILQKLTLLVPTPGQTEQEYLADFFVKKGIYFTQKQTKFNLATALVQLAQRHSLV